MRTIDRYWFTENDVALHDRAVAVTDRCYNPYPKDDAFYRVLIMDDYVGRCLLLNLVFSLGRLGVRV